MVNYRYLPKSIENNHDLYLNDGVISTADDVERARKGRNGG